jgi:uncharacterized protein RhaS with RHS repeats
VGNLTSLIDSMTPSNRTSDYGYDALNELLTIAYTDPNQGDPVPSNVTYTYGANGQRATMADGTGTSSYSYDTLSRLFTYDNGASQAVTYGYDLGGTSLASPTRRLGAARQ